MSKIEKRRRELKMNQAELAAKVGVTQGAISMIENGDRMPSLGLMARIAAVLESTIDELMEDGQHMTA